VEKFKEIKELTRNSTILKPHERSNSCEITSSINRNHNIINENSLNQIDQTTTNDVQLKYENERLKFALAQSTANNRKWDDEIQSLKTNTIRLSTALQETNSNADDLKKQLQYYKDECTRLRNNHNNKQENMDDMDEVSSSTSNNILFNNTNKINNANTKNNAKFKQELVKLTDSFDRKCKELNEIRDQMRKLVNEFN